MAIQKTIPTPKRLSFVDLPYEITLSTVNHPTVTLELVVEGAVVPRNVTITATPAAGVLLDQTGNTYTITATAVPMPTMSRVTFSATESGDGAMAVNATVLAKINVPGVDGEPSNLPPFVN